MANGTDADDLSPLAWVHEEVMRSVTEAVAALLRFSQAHQLARQTDLASVDDADLRMARQPLEALQTARLLEPRPRNIVSKAIEAFRAAFTSSNIVIAANFSISAVLMMKLVEMV